VEVVPSGMAAMLLSLFPLSLFLSSRPRVVDHSETTRMAQDRRGACWWAVSWAEHYGSSGVLFFGGWKKSLLVHLHRRGDACECRLPS
jgi:hypothetical protein